MASTQSEQPDIYMNKKKKRRHQIFAKMASNDSQCWLFSFWKINVQRLLNVDSKISLKPYLFKELSWVTEGTSDEWKEKWAQIPANYCGKLVEAHPKTFDPSHS